MSAFNIPLELESLYEGFVNRDPGKSEQFKTEISAFCVGLARRYAWSLPKDVQEEIVDETLCALLAPGVRRYNPSRGTIKEYLTGFVLNAVRRLREVLYPSLQYPKSLKTRCVGAEIDGSVSLPTMEEVEAGEEGCLVEPEREMVAKIHLDRVLTAAPPMVRMALQAVHIEDEPLSGFARRQGISRFALKRKMDAFIAHHRLVNRATGIHA
jgi:hypothetical protein